MKTTGNHYHVRTCWLKVNSTLVNLGSIGVTLSDVSLFRRTESLLPFLKNDENTDLFLESFLALKSDDTININNSTYLVYNSFKVHAHKNDSPIIHVVLINTQVQLL